MKIIFTKKGVKARQQDLEKLFHLSTAHIKPETFDWLLDVTRTDELRFPFCLYRKEYADASLGKIVTTGVIIHFSDPEYIDILEEYGDIPEELKVILRLVCPFAGWLVLDHDAPHASDYKWLADKQLPVFEWPASYFSDCR